MTTIDLSQNPIFCPLPQRDPGGSFAPDAEIYSPAPGRTAVTASLDASKPSKTNVAQVTPGRTFAPSAESRLQKAKSGEQRGIVVLSTSGKQQPDDTGKSGERIPLMGGDVNPIVGTCGYSKCNRPLRRKTPTGRQPEYCCQAHRVYAWKERQRGGDAIDRT